MSWLLAGCYGLVLMNISGALQISQMPRFIGAITKQNVSISCVTSEGTVQWYKLTKYNDDRKQALEVKEVGKTTITRTRLIILDVRMEHKGVYFCTFNGTWGPGTELDVAKRLSRAKSQYRTQMKDGFIILQALLLTACTVALMLRKQALQEKRDSIYEEPEDEHIYEGLTTQVGGDLYEELCDYAQPEGTEAPWE